MDNNIFSQPVDQDALNLTHAIALQESGNGGVPNYNAVGDNGTSHGAYQWQPGNFAAAATKFGLNPDDLSPENQDKVAYAQVKSYKDQGLQPYQIASMWNSGSPDNYQDHSGTAMINGKPVSYDTPKYVQGVKDHYLALTGGSSQSSQDQSQTIPPTDQTQQTQQPQQQPSVENNLIPNLGGIDTKLSNMHGVIGSLASGAYNAGKGLLNLGKDAAVDLFNTVNNPIGTAKKVAGFVGDELNGGADVSHLDSIGQLVQSTLGSKGALGAGEQIGKLITDTTGKTQGAFNGGQLAGDTINTILTAITGGESGLGEQAVKQSIESAVKNNIITDAMGKTLSQYAEDLAGKALEAGTVGAGFQTATNLQEGKPALQDTGKAFETGLFVPPIAEGASKAASLARGIIPSIPFLNNVSEKEFNSSIDKAFPQNSKEAKLGDTYYDASRDIMNHIVSEKDSIGITDKKGNPKNPSQYTMGDNLEALNTVKPGIYKGYTDLLQGADKEKFQSNIQSSSSDIIKDLKNQQQKTISLPNKQVIATMIKELSSDSMKNADPLDLQNHIQDLGRRAFSGNMTEGKAIIANTAGKLKEVLDNSLDEFTGKQYKELKTTYRAAKVVEAPWTRAALKEIKNTPGLSQKLASLGMTAEGIQFLLTHDPHALIAGLGLKAGAEFAKWLNSPNRYMQKAYKIIEQEQNKGTPQ